MEGSLFLICFTKLTLLLQLELKIFDCGGSFISPSIPQKFTSHLYHFESYFTVSLTEPLVALCLSDFSPSCLLTLLYQKKRVAQEMLGILTTP